ncbi:MAG: MFS transporter [Gammaproteobacteria bacterium]
MAVSKRHNDPKNTSRQTSTLFLLLCLVPLAHLSSTLYLPSLPAIAADLQTTTVAIRWTVTSFFLGFGSSQLFLGYISDRFGRRRPLLIGLLIYTLASLGCLTVTNELQLICLRLVQGFSIGIVPITVHAIFSETLSGKTLARASSYNAMVHALPPMLAPALGSYLQHYSYWQSNFIVLTAYALIMLIWASYALSETRVYHTQTLLDSQIPIPNYLAMLRDRQFIIYSLGLTIAFAIIISFHIMAPFLLQYELNISILDYGHYALLAGLAYLAGSYLFHHISFIFNNTTICKLNCWLIILASLFLLALNQQHHFTLYEFVLVMLVIFFAAGMIFPNMLAGAMAQFPHAAGTASALFGGISLLGTSFISLLDAHISDNDPTHLAMICLVLTTLLLLLLHWLPTTKKQTLLSHQV